MNHELPSSRQIDEAKIDKIGHIIAVPLRREGDEGYNENIDVFSPLNEGDRAQVYQMWAVSKFAENPIALEALEAFGLAGDSDTKENWTQLLEHIAGVTAVARHLEDMMERHGASPIDASALDEAALYDSIQKPQAVEAAMDALETAALVHDVEKHAEVTVSGGGGLENSLDNPVLRDGALWRWLHDHGVNQAVIEAAQNTGRNDRFYSDYSDYSEDLAEKAKMQREKLAHTLGVTTDVVDEMTPAERRRASIEAKERMAGIVGASDAMLAQFRFKGLTEESIDAQSEYYLTYKKDPESKAFFGQDWPEYYKELLRFLIDQIPEANRSAFENELSNLTHEDIFNETVLPHTLGTNNPQSLSRLKYPDAA